MCKSLFGLQGSITKVFRILFKIVHYVKNYLNSLILSNSIFSLFQTSVRKYLALNKEERYSRFRKNIPPSITGQIRSQPVAS